MCFLREDIPFIFETDLFVRIKFAIILFYFEKTNKPF